MTHDQLPLAPHDQDAWAAPPAAPAGRRWRKPSWVIATAVALAAAGAAVMIAGPFRPAGGGVTDSADATGIYTLARQDLSSQTQVPATLGNAGSFTIAAPAGASPQEVSQAQQAVTADQQSLSADGQYEADASGAGNQAITADQASVSTARSALSSDQAAESRDCAGPGATSTACSQDEQKVSADEAQLAQARQQLAAAQSAAVLGHDQNQAKVAPDETKLQQDQATLTSLQASAISPGTTFTWLPAAGDTIREDQPVYSLSDEPVPLLYGSVPAYRAFYVGMSDGSDVAELTGDLIALGYRSGLAQGDHYSPVTASAVKRWQSARGLPATGEILLGEVVFEPGPLQVTSVTPSPGQSVGDGSGAGAGGGAVLEATSTTRQVSIALDAAQQSEVAVGDQVTITLPDNQTTPGVISSVGTVATSPSAASDDPGPSSPTITVLVNPADPAATGTWDQAPVNVTITTGTVSNALVVPVDALLAPGRRRLRRAGGEPRRHVPPRAGQPRPLRRRRRPGPGQRPGPGRRPEDSGAEPMSAGTAGPAIRRLADRPVLEIDQVTRIYPGEPPVTALRQVSFAVGPGELVGIAGPSGSGKTTLLHLMGTLDRPSSGHVRITGLDLGQLSDRELAALRATRIGFVFQQFFLAEHQSVLDNVADGLLYAGVPQQQRRVRALHALGLVGLAGRPLARPHQLSGGQRQRVAIARALAGSPAIVLADEPTGNLDQATGLAILELFEELHRTGVTIVVITHDRDIAARIERRIEMRDGRITSDSAGHAPGLRVPSPAGGAGDARQ
jgi:putative ABC transport system ATP-binding protein